MATTDLTTRVLIEVRDEVRTTNARVDRLEGEVNALRTEMRTELANVRGEVGNVETSVRKAIVESELRTATAITALHGTLLDVATSLKARPDVRKPSKPRKN